MSRLSSVPTLALACLLAASAFGQLCPPDWAPSNFATAVDGKILCAAVYDPGTGPELYVGGDFTTAGGAASAGIAMWNGTTWNGVGGGVTGTVNALCVHDDGTGPQLYVGGWFSGPGNNVARWNGTAWSPCNTGFNSGVQGLASYDDGSGPKLYAGGWFTTSGAGAPAYSRFARWDGIQWNSVGTGLASGMNAICVFQGSLYIFGSFGSAGGIAAPGMVRYNGGGYANIGTVGAGSVNYAIVHDDGTGPAMYICGLFTTVAGVSANRVAKFDGMNWTPLGTGLASLAYGLLSHNDGSGPALYAAGAFTTAGGVPCNLIAKWAGGVWSPLGAGLTGPAACRAMAAYPTPYGVSIFAGGNFASAGSIPVNAPNCALYGPTAPFTVTPPATQTVNAGSNVALSVVAGGQGNTYQWQHNGGPIGGATSATLNLAAVTPLDWGTYDCVMTNGCGTSTSPAATLTLNPAFTLSMTQPFGPLSLFLTHSSPSQPGAFYLTTFSFDPLNASNPGTGPWAGMHVAFQDIVNQFLFLIPPFVGNLDAGGNAGLIIPQFGLPLSLFGVPIWAVSMTFNPSPISLINNSNMQGITIQ